MNGFSKPRFLAAVVTGNTSVLNEKDIPFLSYINNLFQMFLLHRFNINLPLNAFIPHPKV